MEEGFPYPAGTGLAANPPWSGSIGPSVGVVTGNLTFSNLQGTLLAPNNMLQIGGGGSANVYRNFSTNPVASAEGVAVYLSALVNCTLPPTNRQFIACMLPAGSTSPNAPNDPVDLYMTPSLGGCRLAIRSEGSDSATASAILSPNTTHLIVLKYAFGTNDYASLYIDPVPGAPEPAFADAQPGGDGGGEDDDGGGSDAANLQVVLFHSPSFAAQGSINFDTVRVGTNWADVTPLTFTVSVTGPQNQSVCFGSPAVFGVTAIGNPPFSYQWRTNGIPIAGATYNAYTNSSPTAADALNSYDVVVNNMSGSVTSKVASIIFSYAAPSITIPPANQIVLPGISNATFSVSVSGDAPLSFQWRTNGVAIPGATNTSYTITNPGPADAANAIDVVASNPCGSVFSSPPVGVYFPTLFYTAYDAGAGFFSGENLIFTNASGLSFYVWSSPDPLVSVTNWTLEGPMSELPLGTTGHSRYGINLNPVTSPVYYIFAETNAGPYTAAEEVVWLTTPDFASYFVTSSNVNISIDGIFEFPAPPGITQPPQSLTVLAGQNSSLSVIATGPGLGYQWVFKNSGISGASATVLGLTNISSANAGPYVVIVTNSLGSVTSSVATVTVALPPTVKLGSTTPGTIQLNALSIPGLTYVVQTATNLFNPVWLPVLTNNTGAGGVVSFQTNTTGAVLQFYRLVFP